MSKYVTIELVTDDGHLQSMRAEMVEMTANYVMVVRDEKYTCYPWHQIKRLECDSDPHATPPPPYVKPWDYRQAPMGFMGA